MRSVPVRRRQGLRQMRLELCGRGHFPAYRLLPPTPTRALTVLPRTDPLVPGVTLVVRLGVRLGVRTVLRVGVADRAGVRAGVRTVLRVGVADRVLVRSGVRTVLRVGVWDRLWTRGTVPLDRLDVGAVLVDRPADTPTRTLPVFPSNDPRIRGMMPALRPE